MTVAGSAYGADRRTHRWIGPGGPGVDPDAYWACEYPERPPSAGVKWSHDCRACVLHAVACLHNEPGHADRIVQFQRSARHKPRRGRHADLLAWLAEELGDEWLAAYVGRLDGDPGRGRKSFTGRT